MKQARILEVADDQNQDRVTISPNILGQIEKLVETMGLGESTMPLVMHHFLVGGLAYLAAAPISKMRGNELKSLVTKNKAAIRMLAKSVGKSHPDKKEGASET